MKIVIVEDEMPAAKRLEKLIKEIDNDIVIEAKLDSIETAVHWFSNHAQPDLIFMDIELADGQSFEIFNQIKITTPVIFATAYDEFALKAFKVNSIDYLLKPIDKDALRAAIEKFKELKKSFSSEFDINAVLKTLSGNKEGKSRFLVKLGERLISIEKEQIAYFMSEDKLTFLVTHDKNKYVMDYTLDELELQVHSKEFFRINRQFIASAKSIGSIHNYFNGKLKLTLAPPVKEEVLVSRERLHFLRTGWIVNVVSGLQTLTIVFHSQAVSILRVVHGRLLS
ncbi:MAG: LytR/AlgR family response regulator transcription factor [Cytophagales bacterium]